MNSNKKSIKIDNNLADEEKEEEKARWKKASKKQNKKWRLGKKTLALLDRTGYWICSHKSNWKKEPGKLKTKYV